MGAGTETTIAQPPLERGRDEGGALGCPYFARSSGGCVIVVSDTWGGLWLPNHCNTGSRWGEGKAFARVHLDHVLATFARSAPPGGGPDSGAVIRWILAVIRGREGGKGRVGGW